MDQVSTVSPGNYYCYINGRRCWQTKEIDPDSIWMGLCIRGPVASSRSMKFFQSYVKSSRKRIMILGPEEYTDVQGINHVTLLLDMWRGLVKMADQTILAKLRRLEPSTSKKWRLRFNTYMETEATTATEPVSKIIKVRNSTKGDHVQNFC